MKTIKKLLFVFIAVIMTLTYNTVHADIINPGTDGTETTTGSLGGGSWNSPFLGLKFSIVNHDGSVVKGSHIILNGACDTSDGIHCKHGGVSKVFVNNNLPKLKQSSYLPITWANYSFKNFDIEETLPRNWCKGYGYTDYPSSCDIISIYDEYIQPDNYAKLRYIVNKYMGSVNLDSEDFIIVEPMISLGKYYGTAYEFANSPDIGLPYETVKRLFHNTVFVGNTISSLGLNARTDSYCFENRSCGGGIGVFKFDDLYNVTRLEISKIDASGNLLAGATLQLKDSNQNVIYTWTSTNQAYVIEKLKNGTYYLSEVGAPAGYKLSNEIKGIEINDSSSDTIRVNYENELIHKLRISKIDKSTKALIAGAQMELTGPGGYRYTFTTATTPTEISNLEAGTYALKELVAPTGYKKSSQVKTITISKTSSTVTETFENELEHNLKINKVDKETQTFVSGAEMILTGPDGYSKTFTTGNAAYEINDLKVGTYKLKETKAPTGYELSKEEKTIEIKATTSTLTVTFENQPKYINVKIKKLGTKNTLPGALLQIEDETGKVVSCRDSKGEELKECKWVTTTKEEVLQLKMGTYYIRETDAPAGYILLKDRLKFEIKGTETEIKLDFKNEGKPVRLEVTNLREADRTLLPGTELKITDEKGKIVYTWTSEEDKYIVDPIPHGKYYLSVVTPTDGYLLNKQIQEIIIDGTVDVVKKEVLNVQIVDVPDTSKSKLSLFLAIAMSFIAIGICIIVYVKKMRKNNV